jgi:hypothetical protein
VTAEPARDLAWQGSAVADSGAYELVTRAAHPVVILERIARGGGQTRWYVVHDATELSDVVEQLRPGSRVSFYADGRVKHGPFTDEVEVELSDIIVREHGAILGWQLPGTTELTMEFPGHPAEVSELVVDALAQSEVFYGAFPAPDNDGVNAITVDLPDHDGIVRRHPH